MQLSHHFASELSALGTPTQITPIKNPRLVGVNQQLLETLQIDPEYFQEQALFSALFQKDGKFNSRAFAQKYGGHQFGGWNPELGDGRGLLLGEVQDKDGRLQDLHLKGAGQTPYSRFGDGRAVLRSSIREYLASEALHHLGIPTSRALCLLTSDEPVQREQLETAAMLIRTAPSHIRFGHFEYFHHSNHPQLLQQLFNHCFRYYYPALAEQPDRHHKMLETIILDTADLIAKWQAFGFAHGVMNTDNMSIHGITFDYGPYAFMDDFNPELICNHSDHHGRYAFDRQPGVALWNLNALAHGFSQYVELDAIKQALALYEPRLLQQYSQLMTEKLGLTTVQPGDQQLLADLLNQMNDEKRDYTLTFRRLCEVPVSGSTSFFEDHFIDREKIRQWLTRYQQRLSSEQLTDNQRRQFMQQRNPKYILRNYLAQQAISAAEQGDFDEFSQLLKVLQQPFSEQPESQHYAATPPDWGKSMEISCSS